MHLSTSLGFNLVCNQTTPITHKTTLKIFNKIYLTWWSNLWCKKLVTKILIEQLLEKLINKNLVNSQYGLLKSTRNHKLSIISQIKFNNLSN